MINLLDLVYLQLVLLLLGVLVHERLQVGQIPLAVVFLHLFSVLVDIQCWEAIYSLSVAESSVFIISGGTVHVSYLYSVDIFVGFGKLLPGRS